MEKEVVWVSFYIWQQKEKQMNLNSNLSPCDSPTHILHVHLQLAHTDAALLHPTGQPGLPLAAYTTVRRVTADATRDIAAAAVTLRQSAQMFLDVDLLAKTENF